MGWALWSVRAALCRWWVGCGGVGGQLLALRHCIVRPMGAAVGRPSHTAGEPREGSGWGLGERHQRIHGNIDLKSLKYVLKNSFFLPTFKDVGIMVV